ncbi:hypothetical protein NFI96_022521 [Prochilodus magdalenae]|nr:hypothetical protein NFI96_022521 [Prochilodus magdalenae]
MDQNKNKPLFIPWLRMQIDSGQYPGVHWVNHERTRFTIPWKHALRQDSNSDDVRIFKAWAQTSVSSDGRIQGDSSVWKRNFRSALRARGFKMELDNKNDAANPHKVFRWPEDGQPGESREGSQDYDSEIPGEIPVCDDLYLADEDIPLGGAVLPDLLGQCLVALSIGGNEQEIQDTVTVDGQLYLGPPAQFPTAVAVDGVIGEVFPVQETLGLDQFSPVGGAVGGVGHASPTEGAMALGQFSPQEGAFMGTQHCPEEPNLEQPRVPVQGAPTDSGPNQFPTHYKVTVYYKGAKVLEQLVENEAGFRLVFRNDPSLMADGLSVLELPGTDSILDQTQARSTRDILANLGGLEVRKENGALWSHRWGDSRVFWGLDKHEQVAEPRPLSKIQPEPIYSFKDFCSGLMEFMQNRGTPSPSYTLFFCLGQTWPDPRKPWDRKLIMVEVVLTSLEKLKLIAVENGASSLQSDELQLSLEQMMEMC